MTRYRGQYRVIATIRSVHVAVELQTLAFEWHDEKVEPSGGYQATKSPPAWNVVLVVRVPVVGAECTGEIGVVGADFTGLSLFGISSVADYQHNNQRLVSTV